jgi:hypothetical protein
MALVRLPAGNSRNRLADTPARTLADVGVRPATFRRVEIKSPALRRVG